MNNSDLPTPSQLFRLFARGEISREEMHGAIAQHAELIIEEMEEDARNPVVAYLERMHNKRVAARLAKKHGEASVRAVFTILAELPKFPPARYLWNAAHWDVPLHCFIRMRRSPVFRVLRLDLQQKFAKVIVEHGEDGGAGTIRESVTLHRLINGSFTLGARRTL